MERTTTAATDREFEASPFGAGFRADPDERLGRAPTAPPWGRAGRWLALAGAFALHALLVLLVIFEYRWSPQPAPQAEEIPVEIVVEPPPPKPAEPPPPPVPAPSPQPSPETQPLNLEPAHDAPRAANDQKVERPAPDETTKAPARPDTAKAPGEETAPDKPAQPSRQSEAQPAQQQPQPQPTPDKAADASEGALEANSERPDAEAAHAAAQAPAQKAATFVGQPLPNWSKGGSFSTFDQVPDVEFGSAAEQTAIAGGKAKKTYLTLLYGMIMAHVHYASSGHEREGEIVFILDGKGNLLQRQIERPSGSMELDAAALGAVGEAAPYPAPPTGSSVRLTFTYGAH